MQNSLLVGSKGARSKRLRPLGYHMLAHLSLTSHSRSQTTMANHLSLSLVALGAARLSPPAQLLEHSVHLLHAAGGVLAFRLSRLVQLPWCIRDNDLLGDCVPAFVCQDRRIRQRHARAGREVVHAAGRPMQSAFTH
jgi:hypothetical protein